MTPNVAHHFSAVLRSLQDAVLPALDTSNKLALQQMHLCITTLRLMAKQHDFAYHVALTELRLYTRFLRKVAAGACRALAPALRARLTNAAAERLSQFTAPKRMHIDAITRELREVADELVAAPALRSDSELHARIMSAVRELNSDEAVLRRAWLGPMGADAEIKTLPKMVEPVAPTEEPIETT
jgi:hypothetical protein